MDIIILSRLFPSKEHFLSRSGSHTIQIRHVKTGQSAPGTLEFDDLKITTGIFHSTIYHFVNGKCKTYTIGSSEFEAYSCLRNGVIEEAYTPSNNCTYWTQATAVSPDGRLVATCTAAQVTIWYATGRLAGNLAGGPFGINGVMCIAFSADAQRLVTGSGDGMVRMLNVEIVEDPNISAEQESILSTVVFAPDGRQIVIGLKQGVIRGLDASTAEENYTFTLSTQYPNNEVSPIISPSGNLFASAEPDGVHILNKTTGELVGPLRLEKDTGTISFHAFSTQLDDHLVIGTFNGVDWCAARWS